MESVAGRSPGAGGRDASQPIRLDRDELYAVIADALGHPAFPPMVEAIVEFVALWMADWYQRPELEFRMPRDWREEMG
jgi:hypothetical protein